MRKYIYILLFVFINVNLFAQTNYYVSNDGDDSNTGLSDEQSWETLDHISGFSFSAGDTVFFKSGDTWNETLVIDDIGTSENPIVFTSYGSGDQPYFSTDVHYTGWQEYDTNIFFVTAKESSYSICLFQDTIWGLEEDTVSDLNENHEWHEYIDFPAGTSNDTLFIYVTDHSDTSTIINSFSANVVYFDGAEYVEIRDIEMKYGGSRGVYLYSYAYYVTIDSCTITWNGGNGVQIGEGGYHVISNCNLSYNGNDATWMNYTTHNTFEYNDMLHNGHRPGGGDGQVVGIWYADSSDINNNYMLHTGRGTVIESSCFTGYEQAGTKIYDNHIVLKEEAESYTVINAYRGDYLIYGNLIDMTETPSSSTLLYTGYGDTSTIINFYNNTVLKPGNVLSLYSRTETIGNGDVDITLKNNVFDSVQTENIRQHNGFASVLYPFVTMDNNLYTDDTGTKFGWLSTQYDFTDWKTVSSLGVNSQVDEPDFVDRTDYHLSEGSPAIDAGVADAAFNATGITYTGTPDIGYWQSDYTTTQYKPGASGGKLIIDASGNLMRYNIE